MQHSSSVVVEKAVRPQFNEAERSEYRRIVEGGTTDASTWEQLECSHRLHKRLCRRAHVLEQRALCPERSLRTRGCGGLESQRVLQHIERSSLPLLRAMASSSHVLHRRQHSTTSLAAAALVEALQLKTLGGSACKERERRILAA